MAITNPTKYVTVRRLERFKAKLNLLNPLSLPDLSHNYEFKKNDALAIGGIIYRCTANSTTKPPFDFVFDENNKIVYTELNGQRAYTADSGTLNTGWEVYFDLQDRFFVEEVRQDLTTDINSVLTVADSKIPLSQKGTAGGVAELDENGKVLSSQLPSYVDDVIEAYYNPSDGKFYAAKSGTTYSDEITSESGKIYVDLDTEKTYRWGGSSYAEISPSLALGETSSTAYRGDRGKTAYDHSQSTHARTDATKTEASQTNGNIKINGTETNVYTHPSGTNPHGTTKSDVGLGNVGNFKAVSTEASQGLSNTEKSNARANIGAGTYSKASGGIPKTDLESAVQTSLGKADSALQSHQDISGKADKSSTVSTVAYDTTNKKLTKTINGATTDIVTALKLAQDAGALVVNLVDLSTVTHDYTFKKYDGLCIDGVLYRCTADTTTKPPFDFVFDSDNKIVYDTSDGEDVFLVDSNTLNTGWEKYLDLRDRLHIDQVREGLQEQITELSESKQDVLEFDTEPTEDSENPVTSGGVYTALDGKQDTLQYDSVPTSGSQKMVKSGGIYKSLATVIRQYATSSWVTQTLTAGKCEISTDTSTTHSVTINTDVASYESFAFAVYSAPGSTINIQAVIASQNPQPTYKNKTLTHPTDLAAGTYYFEVVCVGGLVYLKSSYVEFSEIT